MDSELRAAMVLHDLGLSPAEGETALDAVLRLAREADRVLRPYRYEQVDGMRTAFQFWWQNWPRRALYTEPGGYVSADIGNAFQAGYTARGSNE